MRSIWKGEVSFGLVNVPVKVYSATEDHDLRARQVDKKDGVRIRYKRVRDDNGEEVEYSDIAKAYESDDGETVILTKDELASLPVEQNHEIEVTEFVPADQVDPVAFDNAYFLEPASRSNRAYVLMREALESTDRLAICTFTLRNRTRLCALRVYKDVLMLQTLLWPDEIRPAILEGLDKEAKVRPQEVKMAASLIETMAADFEPEKYEDDYQNQLKELIEAKAAGGEAFTVEEREEASDDDGDDEVADLLAALRASVKDRGGEADDESDDDEDSGSGKKSSAKKSNSSSAKKTATKKAPAKKAAAKKSTAKKEPAKKSTSKSSSARKSTAKKAPAKKSA
ncbi:MULTISPECIES: Ku protein [unclassified Dietzia]|uniref:non-homologous end joining protein Ku n=1 Tax=unclassified Dietzia TaxID=2617939 RepID=UPI0007D0D27A|nr:MULTISPECIES: Ku protein [unclassified Dietzia]AJO29713.1 Ku protein [Dietzia sp. DQ12-45-1b]AVZ40309.1 Ku protein [Dietzia sp. JS16-p6b]QGW25785.1 Ku protein [Dietzia sp. DQ12-45-1b]